MCQTCISLPCNLITFKIESFSVILYTWALRWSSEMPEGGRASPTTTATLVNCVHSNRQGQIKGCSRTRCWDASLFLIPMTCFVTMVPLAHRPSLQLSVKVFPEYLFWEHSRVHIFIQWGICCLQSIFKSVLPWLFGRSQSGSSSWSSPTGKRCKYNPCWVWYKCQGSSLSC